MTMRTNDLLPHVTWTDPHEDNSVGEKSAYDTLKHRKFKSQQNESTNNRLLEVRTVVTLVWWGE